MNSFGSAGASKYVICISLLNMVKTNHLGGKPGSVVIFVDRRTDIFRVQRLLPTLSTAVIVVAVDDHLPHWPVACLNSVKLKRLHDYGVVERDVRREAMYWLRNWSNTELQDGSTVKTRLLYEGISLWWFFDPWWLLCDSRFFRALPDTFCHLDQVCSVLQVELPSEVISFCTDGEFNATVRSACNLNGLRFRLIGPAPARYKVFLKQLASWAYLARLVARAVLGRIHSAILPPPSIEENRHPALVLTGDNWGQVLDLISGQFAEGDGYLYGVLAEIQQNFSLTMAIEMHPRKLLIVDRGRKERISGVKYRPFEAFVDTTAGWKAFKGWLRMRRNWQSLRACRELHERSRYHGIPVWDFLQARLDVFFAGGALDALLSVETALAAIRTERPRSILMDCRMCRSGRALIHAANVLHVPTVSIEHGFFLPDNPSDFLSAADIAEARKKPELACPLPRKIMVYGERDRQLMVAGHFPAKLIEVTGAPRWDGLPLLKKNLNKVAVCGTYSLDPTKPIVLLATQDHYPEAEQDDLCRAISAAVRKIPRAQLVVKLHPLDKTLAAARKKYNTIARQEGLAGALVLDGRILHELLCISDVLVSMACNSAIEASLIGVPVIIADLFGRGMADSFLFHPALLQARSPAQILEHLQTVLFDSAAQRTLASHRADFISKYCYRADGMAWRRVLQHFLEQVASFQVAAHPNQSLTVESSYAAELH